jgi:gamma-glutamylcyclotransferase (GGCT)/AIG2-like uncharacterized protein YtfP
VTKEAGARSLFVYGTLLPGQDRWPFLAPFVTARSGDVDWVHGTLWDTGLGFPAFTRDGGSTVHGQVFELRRERCEEALEVLDAVEAAVDGLYQRIALVTGRGRAVWVYEGGAGLTLTPIPGGNWLEHDRYGRA